MTRKTGTYMGGVWTVEDLKSRCRIDEDTGCWHWSLSFLNGMPRVYYRAPDGSGPRHDRGRRAALVLLRGAPLPPGHIAWPKAMCQSPGCVNPKHAQSGTKQEWGRWLAQTDAMKNLPSKAAASRKAWDTRGRKVTPDMVQEILHSNESLASLSKRLGVSAFAVGSVRLRKSHLPTMKNASVFAWRP